MPIIIMSDQQPKMETESHLFDDKYESARNRNSDDWDSEQTATTTPAKDQAVIDTDKNQSNIREQDHDSDSSVDPGAEEEGPTPANDAIPDGGTAAWLAVLGAWCVSFCSYGWINSIGTFQEYYQSGPLQSYTTSQISWIPSLQIFFMSVLGPLIGAVYDRHGMRLLLLVGSLLHVFGLMMASISSEYYQFLLSQGVCSAVGVAVCFLSAISAVTGWFDKRRGLAFGVLSTGSSLGGVVFPIMLSRLIKSVGYGWAMRSCAFMILGLLGVANLTLRTRGEVGSGKGRGDGGSMRSKMGGGRKMWRPFREVPFLLLLGGLFLVPFGLYVPINYLPVASIGAGVSKDMSQNLVAIYNGASLVGRFSSGFISDKAGRFNVFITSCYLAGILILAMWVPVSDSMPNVSAVSIAFAVLFGIFSGGYISLMASLVAAISPMEEIGYRNGLTFLFSSVGGLVTSPIAGAILEAGDGNWVGLKTFAGVFMVAGTSFILAARVACVGWGLTKVF